MSNIEKAEGIAEYLRYERYAIFRNDCITKSSRFKKVCSSMGIPAKLVICLGYSRARVCGRHLMLPVIHGWGEVEGRRIETSRPLGHAGWLGIVPVHIKPLLA
jgi:hypothetical protein